LFICNHAEIKDIRELVGIQITTVVFLGVKRKLRTITSDRSSFIDDKTPRESYFVKSSSIAWTVGLC